MSLNQETVKRIATLARLKLNSQQMVSMEHDLNSILQFIDELNEVDTSEVAPMSGGILTPQLSLRKDEVTDGNYVDKIEKKAKNIEGVEAFFTFGHVADGNIHFIFAKSNTNQNLTTKINDLVYEPLKEIGGSVSAEHGIGVHKKHYLKFCRNESEIELMRTLKRTMDSKNILNRGKVL